MKQAPLVFVVMSRKGKADYGAVCRTVLNQLPTVLVVDSITVDFEDGTWQDRCQVLPDMQLRGCVFYSTQTVQSKI